MPSNKLFVGNLGYQTTPDDLRELFSSYGTVVSVKIIEGRGFGFVEMDTPESATNAKDELNDTELRGRSIRVDEARPNPQRGRGGGGGGRQGRRRW